jgi:hypothetical protein
MLKRIRNIPCPRPTLRARYEPFTWRPENHLPCTASPIRPTPLRSGGMTALWCVARRLLESNRFPCSGCWLAGPGGYFAATSAAPNTRWPSAYAYKDLDVGDVEGDIVCRCNRRMDQHYRESYALLSLPQQAAKASLSVTTTIFEMPSWIRSGSVTPSTCGPMKAPILIFILPHSYYFSCSTTALC